MIATRGESTSVLDEAFGRHMLDGTAEWSDVPEVIRSSFYVLHKAYRAYDRRLSRCEKSVAACLDRQARTELELAQRRRRDDDACAMRRPSSGHELASLQEQLSSIKDELVTKADKGGVLSMVHGAVRDTNDDHTKLITEKLQAHKSHLETAMLKMKTVLSRKLLAVEGHARHELVSANAHIEEQGKGLQEALQHTSRLEATVGAVQATAKAAHDRLCDIESCIGAMYRGVGIDSPEPRSVCALATTVTSAQIQDNLVARVREMIQSGQTQATQVTTRALQEMRDQLSAVQQHLRQVETQVSAWPPTQSVQTPGGKLPSPVDAVRPGQVEVQFELLQEQAVKLSAQLKDLETMAHSAHIPEFRRVAAPIEPPQDVATSRTMGDDFVTTSIAPTTKERSTDVGENNDGHSVVVSPRATCQMESKKLDLRLKRELSRARFDQVALRQKERLRGRHPPSQQL